MHYTYTTSYVRQVDILASDMEFEVKSVFLITLFTINRIVLRISNLQESGRNCYYLI